MGNTAKRKRKYLRRKKAGWGCIRCRIKDPRVLELHHPTTRGADLASLSWEMLEEELARCTVWCCNCRLIHQWEERHPGEEYRPIKTSWTVSELLEADLDELEE